MTMTNAQTMIIATEIGGGDLGSPVFYSTGETPTHIRQGVEWDCGGLVCELGDPTPIPDGWELARHEIEHNWVLVRAARPCQCGSGLPWDRCMEDPGGFCG